VKTGVQAVRDRLKLLDSGVRRNDGKRQRADFFTASHHRLLFQFGNGEEKVFDVSPYLNVGKFAELQNISLFNSVVVRFDTIEWANHLDIDPEFLYEKSVTVKV
jgi:hypothetical protein